MSNALFRRILRNTFGALLALLLLFEEWGWEPLAALLARLGRLPLLRRIEAGISRLPPWAALATFALPALALLPVKLLALWLFGTGHATWGLVLLVGAKLAGTAVLARLFALTQPALMQLAWFARWYPRWKAWKDLMFERMRRSAPWRSMRRAKARARAAWHAWRRAWKDDGAGGGG